jgi:Tat protein secretion system quality control protein TatD with DNase activity
VENELAKKILCVMKLYRFVLGQNPFASATNRFKKQNQLAKQYKLPIVIHEKL